MSEVLHAWLEDHYAGRFQRDDDGRVSFEYAADAPETPVSLSLPRRGAHERRAAQRYLDNLLPDRPQARLWMQQASGAKSTDAWDLLAVVGSDVAGGLVLSTDDSQPSVSGEPVLPATDDEIAYRIRVLKEYSDQWVDPELRPRFSLAGTQAKFALARFGNRWFWPSATTPSTHIVKPGNPRHPQIEPLEAGTLQFAATVGVAAPDASSLSVFDQSAFIVKRFDREVSLGMPARRLHAEDFAQASGLHPDRKYDMTFVQALELLRPVDEDDQLRYEFVRQVVFNTVVGNADAHAKNYSLLLRPDGVELSALYDSLPTTAYEGYDPTLAMRISGARMPQAVMLPHWRKAASRAGLDPDRVAAIVADVSQGVLSNIDDAYPDVDESMRTKVAGLIRRNAHQAVNDTGRRRASSTQRVRRGHVGLSGTDNGGTAGSYAPRRRPESDVELD